MSSSLSMSSVFLFEDSSSSDHLEIEDLCQDDDPEHKITTLATKELEDRATMNKRRGSMASRVCIPPH
jgi:hypothetical protein